MQMFNQGFSYSWHEIPHASDWSFIKLSISANIKSWLREEGWLLLDYFALKEVNREKDEVRNGVFNWNNKKTVSPFPPKPFDLYKPVFRP